MIVTAVVGTGAAVAFWLALTGYLTGHRGIHREAITGVVPLPTPEVATGSSPLPVPGPTVSAATAMSTPTPMASPPAQPLTPTPTLTPTPAPTPTPTATPAPPSPVANKKKSYRLLAAEQTLEMEDYKGAQNLYRALLADDPNSKEAKEGLEKIRQYAAGEAEAGDQHLRNDPQAAFQHYQIAADLDDPKGQLGLGYLYNHQWPGHEREPEKAADYYGRAARQGLTAAQYSLAVMKGESSDPDEMVRLLILAAKQDDVYAEYDLGRMYEQGWRGHPREPEHAVIYYRKAAAHGSSEAKQRLSALGEKFP